MKFKWSIQLYPTELLLDQSYDSYSSFFSVFVKLNDAVFTLINTFLLLLLFEMIFEKTRFGIRMRNILWKTDQKFLENLGFFLVFLLKFYSLFPWITSLKKCRYFKTNMRKFKDPIQIGFPGHVIHRVLVLSFIIMTQLSYMTF